MNKLMMLMAACVLAAAPAFAADTAKPAAATTAAAPAAAAPAAATPATTNSQQEKMKVCNTKAEGKTGDDRKKFMSDCLSAKPRRAQAGEQDGDVQQADGGNVGRRPLQGAVRMHEGTAARRPRLLAGQGFSEEFHVAQKLLNTAG